MYIYLHFFFQDLKVISMPRARGTQERYFLDVGEAVNHQMEFRLFPVSFGTTIGRSYHHDKSTTGRIDSFILNFDIMDRDNTKVIGHPWPFRELSSKIDAFFWADAF